MKSTILAMLGVTAVYLLIKSPPADSDLMRGRVVVDYWEKWTGDEGRQMRQVVDDFNNSQQKIFVRYVTSSDVNQKTLVATAAGVPPDVAGLWDKNLCQFAELDALSPLETMATAHGLTASTYKPVYWKGCNYKGHLYGLVSTPSAIALHYNTKIFADNADLLRRAGLDPDRPPRSIAELDRYSQALDEFDDRGRLIRTGHLPTEPGWYVDYIYLWFGGDIWDPASQRFTLTDPKVIQAFEWVQSYARRLGHSSITAFEGAQGNYDSPQNGFMAGTVAMEQQGPWMANHVLCLQPSMDGLARLPGETNDALAERDSARPLAERLKQTRWAATAFPSAVEGLQDVSYCEFDALVIPRGAKHPQEAFEFIAYVNQQAVMEKLCNLHSKNSPLSAVSEHFLLHHKNPYVDVFERLSRGPNAHSLPQIPILPEVLDELSTFVEQLMQTPLRPRDGLTAMQRRLQASYDLFTEKQRQRRASN